MLLLEREKWRNSITMKIPLDSQVVSHAQNMSEIPEVSEQPKASLNKISVITTAFKGPCRR